MPKFSFLKSLGFRRSRSPKPPKANSSHATGVHASSRPSSVHGRLQQGQGGPVTAATNISNDSAGQSDRESQLMSSPVVPNSAQTPAPSSSVAPPPINPVPPSQTTESNPLQHQDLLLAPGQSSTTASQTSLLSPQWTPTPRQDGNSGTNYVQNTHELRSVSVQGDGNNVNYSNTNTVNNNPNNRFMEKLLERTIIGAAFNSAARDPPPRCHPGTRLAILARCLEFIANDIDGRKMRWVFGAAGVGKSAIMQSVVESTLPSVSHHVSIFFSINGRNDGTKTIITLAFQLAAKCEAYRQFIEYEITRDPSLLQSLLPVQFEKFIVEPIIHRSLPGFRRILIVIDGLDECDKSHTQRGLLQLIYDVCFTHSSSPIVWMIASRPEPHIQSFFAQEYVKAVYEKEEILVDSDEARNDVERLLRDELTRIQKEFSVNPGSQWPPEQELWELADASSGLFVFADTAIKYIGDHTIGNPKSQLNDVLKAIDAHPLPGIPRKEHPMARLDALYAQIISKVPERVMVHTRKILLALVWESKAKEHLRKENFIVFCNWLGMTCDDAYAAIRHLSSVLDDPPRNEAHKKKLRPFHKSFIDYISDHTRSGFSSDIKHEAYLLETQYAIRVLEQAPNGIDFGYVDYIVHDTPMPSSMAVLARGPGTGSDISLAWPVNEAIDWNDNGTRLQMYKLAVSNVVEGLKQGESAFCTEFCICLLLSRFDSYNFSLFPYRELRDLMFETSRRHELMDKGILKQVPVKVLDFINITWHVRMQFRRPTATLTNPSHPWKRSCTHKRAGDWAEGKDENWTTEFEAGVPITPPCRTCCIRLKRQLDDWKTQSPDQPTTILFTSTGTSFVEFQFIDPDDEVSEWTYWFTYKISAEERRKLGSTV